MLRAMQARLASSGREAATRFPAAKIPVAELLSGFRIDDVRSVVMQVATDLGSAMLADPDAIRGDVQDRLAAALWMPEMLATAIDLFPLLGQGAVASSSQTLELWIANGGSPDFDPELRSLCLAAWIQVYSHASSVATTPPAATPAARGSGVRPMFHWIYGILAAAQGVFAINDLTHARNSDLSAWALITDVLAGLLMVGLFRATKSDDMERLSAYNYLLYRTWMVTAAGAIVICVLRGPIDKAFSNVVWLLMLIVITYMGDNRGSGKDAATKLLGAKSKALRDRLVSNQREARATD